MFALFYGRIPHLFHRRACGTRDGRALADGMDVLKCEGVEPEGHGPPYVPLVESRRSAPSGEDLYGPRSRTGASLGNARSDNETSAVWAYTPRKYTQNDAVTDVLSSSGNGNLT